MNVPGPGKYKPRKHRLGGKVKMGTSKRRPLSGISNTPGSGTYKTRSKFDGPKFGITPKRDPLSSNMLVPGPGRYHPQVTQTK